jgi:hypothetical protein
MWSTTPSATRKSASFDKLQEKRQVMLGWAGLSDHLDLAALGQA